LGPGRENYKLLPKVEDIGRPGRSTSNLREWLEKKIKEKIHFTSSEFEILIPKNMKKSSLRGTANNLRQIHFRYN
jgi:hypothetical protein